MSAGAPVLVYDGLRLLGEVRELGRGRHEALDGDGRVLGTFASREDARGAVMAAAQEGARR